MKPRRVLRGLHQLGEALDARVMAAGDIPHVTVGRHTYGLRWSSVMGATASSPVTIGNFCSIAPEVTFLCHVGHPVDLPSTYPFRTLMFDRPAVAGGLNADAITRGSIVVGHDVWLGYRVTVLSGVTIGTGAVVGAGATVTRDIPPYALAVGCPARVVRHRFDEETVAALLASRWWELPDESLATLEPELYDRDIQKFFAAVEEIRARQATT